MVKTMPASGRMVLVVGCAMVLHLLAASAQSLNTVSPSQGSSAGGRTVTLSGTGFSYNVLENDVFLGGRRATIETASSTQIVVMAPPAGTDYSDDLGLFSFLGQQEEVAYKDELTACPQGSTPSIPTEVRDRIKCIPESDGYAPDDWLFDSDPNTVWHSQNGLQSQVIQVDLGKIMSVSAVRIKWAGENSANVIRIKLHIPCDGTFTNIVAGQSLALPNVWDAVHIVTFGSTDVRFLDLTVEGLRKEDFRIRDIVVIGEPLGLTNQILTVAVDGEPLPCGGTCGFDYMTPPTISSVNPTMGTAGNAIQITGTGLIFSCTDYEVLVGGTVCQVTGCAGQVITCTVEDQPAGYYPIKLFVNGLGYAYGILEFLQQPQVDQKIATLIQGTKKPTFLIDGSGFSEIESQNKVSVCGRPCEVAESTSSQIQCHPTPPARNFGSLVRSVYEDALEFTQEGTIVDSLTTLPFTLGAVFGQGLFAPQQIFLRFQYVDIPHKAQISSASLRLISEGPSCSPGSELLILAESSLDSQPFVPAQRWSLSTRATTQASVLWQVSQTWQGNGLQTSPDITPLINELVQNPKWVHGAAITFIIKQKGRSNVGDACVIRARESGQPAQLAVEYTTDTNGKIAEEEEELTGENCAVGIEVNAMPNEELCGSGSPLTIIGANATSSRVGDSKALVRDIFPKKTQQFSWDEAFLACTLQGAEICSLDQLVDLWGTAPLTFNTYVPVLEPTVPGSKMFAFNMWAKTNDGTLLSWPTWGNGGSESVPYTSQYACCGNTGHPAYMALDGSDDTFWEGSGSLVAQTQETAFVKRVVIFWADKFAKMYELEVSVDGIKYTRVYKTSDGDGDLDEITIPERFSSTPVNYVRLVIDGPEGVRYAIRELVVSGCASGPPLMTEYIPPVPQPSEIPPPPPSPKSISSSSSSSDTSTGTSSSSSSVVAATVTMEEPTTASEHLPGLPPPQSTKFTSQTSSKSSSGTSSSSSSSTLVTNNVDIEDSLARSPTSAEELAEPSTKAEDPQTEAPQFDVTQSSAIESTPAPAPPIVNPTEGASTAGDSIDDILPSTFKELLVAEGTVSLSSGEGVYIPQGALPAPTLISVRDTAQLLETSVEQPVFVSKMLTFGPSGLQFSQPAKLIFNALSNASSGSRLAVHRLNTTSGRWVEKAGTWMEGRNVMAYTSSFSTYAVLEVPIQPQYNKPASILIGGDVLTPIGAIEEESPTMEATEKKGLKFWHVIVIGVSSAVASATLCTLTLYALSVWGRKGTPSARRKSSIKKSTANGPWQGELEEKAVSHPVQGSEVAVDCGYTTHDVNNAMSFEEGQPTAPSPFNAHNATVSAGNFGIADTASKGLCAISMNTAHEHDKFIAFKKPKMPSGFQTDFKVSDPLNRVDCFASVQHDAVSIESAFVHQNGTYATALDEERERKIRSISEALIKGESQIAMSSKLVNNWTQPNDDYFTDEDCDAAKCSLQERRRSEGGVVLRSTLKRNGSPKARPPSLCVGVEEDGETRTASFDRRHSEGGMLLESTLTRNSLRPPTLNLDKGLPHVDDDFATDLPDIKHCHMPSNKDVRVGSIRYAPDAQPLELLPLRKGANIFSPGLALATMVSPSGRLFQQMISPVGAAAGMWFSSWINSAGSTPTGSKQSTPKNSDGPAPSLIVKGPPKSPAGFAVDEAVVARCSMRSSATLDGLRSRPHTSMCDTPPKTTTESVNLQVAVVLPAVDRVTADPSYELKWGEMNVPGSSIVMNAVAPVNTEIVKVPFVATNTGGMRQRRRSVESVESVHDAVDVGEI